MLGVAAALVDGTIVSGDVRLDDGRIGEVGVHRDRSDRSAAPGTVAVAGFVDLQVNGFAGVDLRTADAGGYATVAAGLARRGVTGFCPTFHSQSVDGYLASLGQLAAVHSDRPVGARVLGAHLEGPFLSPRWSGAHDPAHLSEPDLQVLGRLLAAGHVAMMTLAPELPDADRIIAALVDEGVVVAMGHTDATAAQSVEAFDRGVRHLTHCWNAHRRFAPRDPGPAGAALTHRDVAVGLIGDLVHVAPEVVSMTMAAAGHRVAATTDAVTAAGTGAGPAGAVARTEQGTIAGGLCGMDDVFRNLVAVGVDFADAAAACGAVQRDVLGLPPVRMLPGDRADVVVLGPALEVTATYVDGQRVDDLT